MAPAPHHGSRRKGELELVLCGIKDQQPGESTTASGAGRRRESPGSGLQKERAAG